MSQESVLYQELEKLDLNEIKKIATLWNIHKLPGKDKKSTILGLMEVFQSEFYLKGVLEKFSPLQVNIITSILKNKGVMTLGEIARKVNIPPINIEMELNVLRKYYLVYQRKNRERLTNNLDKYHAYEEFVKLIKVETNQKSEKFKFSIEKSLHKATYAEIPTEWKEAIGAKKQDS
ncbi:helicase, partial [Leptospira ognonensis]